MKLLFMAVFTYTLPHAELAQPEDSILIGYKVNSLKIKLGVGAKALGIIL
jgi:hypothetical protein